MGPPAYQNQVSEVVQQGPLPHGGGPAGREGQASPVAWPSSLCWSSASHSPHRGSLPSAPCLSPFPSCWLLFSRPGIEPHFGQSSAVFKFNGRSCFFPPQHLGWALCCSPGERQVNNSGRVECLKHWRGVCGRAASLSHPREGVQEGWSRCLGPVLLSLCL